MHSIKYLELEDNNEGKNGNVHEYADMYRSTTYEAGSQMLRVQNQMMQGKQDWSKIALI